MRWIVIAMAMMLSPAGVFAERSGPTISAQQKAPLVVKPLSTEYRIDVTDEGFVTSDVYAEVGDTIIVVGAEDMARTLSVTVVQPTLFSGLSSNPFSVSKDVTVGPFTIGGSGNNVIELELSGNQLFSGGGDIVTIHVDP